MNPRGLLDDGSFAVRPAPAVRATYELFHWGARGPCDLDALIGCIDDHHAEPLRALEVGEEYEIPQMGMPSMFVVRKS